MKFEMKYTFSIYILTVLIISGSCFSSCNVGTAYVRPEQKTIATYGQDFPQDSSITNIPWWDLFNDAVLIDLIDSALVNNKDIKTTIYRMQQSQLLMNIADADLMPTINYGVIGSSSVNSKTSNFSNAITPIVSASYTLDLWHKVRNLNEIALQTYLASEEVYKAVQVGLISGIAQAYIALRDLDNRLSISEKTANNFQGNLDVMTARFNGGFISEVDLYQSKIQLNEAKTAIEIFLRARGQLENSISVLIGSTPIRIPRGLPLFEQFSLPEIPIGVPSELLDRRPDVLIAEKALHIQTLQIGVKEALRYPSLTLTADIGAELINPSLLFANLGAQILGPLFNSNKLRNVVAIEKIKTQEFLNTYEQTFLNAVKEVEDAMIAVNTYKKEYELRNSQMEMAKNAAELSWVRYDAGLTSYLEVLNLQNSQFSAELKTSEVFMQELVSLIKLYEALGGGWIPTTENLNEPESENNN